MATQQAVRLLRVALLCALAAAPRVSGGEDDGHSAAMKEPKVHAKLDTARRFYEGKVAQNAQDADSWHGLAVILRRSEMHAEAALAMTRAVDIAPTAVRHRELGLILRLAGHEERGVRHLIESVRGGALSPTTLLMIGRFQHHQGEMDVAARTLLLALRLTDPALRGGHAVALTMCLLDAKRYSEAQRAFRAAARDKLFHSSTTTTLNPMLGIVWPRATSLEQQRYIH